jgi:hypothetical protein
MRRSMRLALAAVAIAAPLTALPTLASADSCGARAHDRRVAGTLLGGIGGALLGNAIRKGGTGAVVGGIGGAVIGNQLSRVNCDRTYSSRSYRSSYARTSRPAAAPRAAVRYVYYDRYGAPVSSGPAPQYQAVGGQPVYTPVAYAASGSCRSENRAFYDERGSLVYRPVQMCAR